MPSAHGQAQDVDFASPVLYGIAANASAYDASFTNVTVVDKTVLQATLPPAVTTTPPGSPNPTQDGAGPAEIIVALTNGLSSAPGGRSVFDYVDEAAASDVVPTVAGVSPYGGLDTSPTTVVVLGSGFVSPATACPVDNGAAGQPLNLRTTSARWKSRSLRRRDEAPSQVR